MARVYLETSFFSACVSTRRDARSVTWRQTSLEWWNDQSNRHELFISGEVVAELSDPEFPNWQDALAMLRGLTLLPLTDEVSGFAEILVREKVMPAPSVSGDALHVAAATVHEMQYLLAWNVKHLANPRKRQHLAVICMRFGFIPPQIVTPDLLQEADDA